ncbi:solute carrier family 22 member 6-A-like [Haliotis rufescens]|uniref:solute carrier family 22 member 6-A-like n=1 Tax=Haliotis rufescens TaxID=6454 RepID=UPI00201FB194|nr:solute carrier family 22 member 6-A-like [Haliotis rufescens]
MADVKQEPPRTIDSILELLGSLGRYQLFQAVLLCIGNLTICFHLLNFVFIAQTVKQQCEVTPLYGNNSNTNYGTCDVSVQNTTTNVTSTHTCSAWTYDVQKDHSIVSEWDLVCGNVFFARLPQSLFIVGQGVGAATVSGMSDKFGRKPFLLLSHILTAGAGLALAFSPNIAAFSALRLVNGIFQQGIVVCTYTMIMETFPRSKRIEISTFYTLSWNFSTILLTGTAYLLRDMDWRTLQLCFVSVSISVFLQIFFMAESLRWLITNKKVKRAMALFKRVAKTNRLDVTDVQLPGIDITQTPVDLSSTKSKYVETPPEKQPEVVKYSCLDLVRTKFMLKICAVVWFSWLVDSLTYFSLYLTSSSLHDDQYLNFFLNSLAGVPSGPLFWFVGRRWGRRVFFMSFHVLAGVCLLLATTVRAFAVGQAASVTATVLAFVGKIGNSACFNAMFVYAPEIYPTNLRSAGMGSGSTAARVGGMIAPFISILAEIVPWAPGTIFGIACLVTAALNYMLPEAEGRELPQTIEDVKAWGKAPARG